MPTFTRGDVSLYYEEFGQGYPLLLLAPGGMRSTIDFWQRMSFDPTKEFASELESMREKFYGGEFVFSVSRDFVHTSNTPMLVLAGNDAFHPTAIAEEIAKLAPNAELVMQWREPEVVAETIKHVRAFLRSHTPI